MNGIKRGDRAFMLLNNKDIIQVVVLDCFGGLYTVRLPDGTACRVKNHRLHATQTEAEATRCRKRAPSFRMSGTMYT